MKNKTEKKTDGNDLFILHLIDAFESSLTAYTMTHQGGGAYSQSFLIDTISVAEVRVYACSPGYLLTYYDNTSFKSVWNVRRIETSLPTIFSQEMASLKFFSVQIETLLVYSAALGNPTEDLKLYLSIAEGAYLLVIINNKEVCTIEQSSCANSYYQETVDGQLVNTDCCAAFTECTVQNYVLSSTKPNYMILKYVHKENKPCLRMQRSSTSLTQASLDNEAYAGINLREAPFKVKSIINVNEISTTSTVMEIEPLINTNTGKLL